MITEFNWRSLVKNVLLQKAIEYARRGWHVFPCREKDSKPFVNQKGKEIVIPMKAPYNKGGLNMATRDENQIKLWWDKHPEACIGVNCGLSGITVIDIDVRDGKKGFYSFLTMGISDQGAFHAITASGGLHLVYSGTMSSHANVKAGVDIRSNGAYFIVPPSYLYEDGKKKFYKQVGDWNGQPLELPSNLEDKFNWLKGKEKKQVSQKEYPKESLDKTTKRVKIALEKIPQWVCEDYFTWINVGMALKTLGEEGFSLWNEWSKKSSKYDEDALIYRWENFQPNEITIASIFYYAKQAPKEIA